MQLILASFLGISLFLIAWPIYHHSPPKEKPGLQGGFLVGEQPQEVVTPTCSRGWCAEQSNSAWEPKACTVQGETFRNQASIRSPQPQGEKSQQSPSLSGPLCAEATRKGGRLLATPGHTVHFNKQQQTVLSEGSFLSEWGPLG